MHITYTTKTVEKEFLSEDVLKEIKSKKDFKAKKGKYDFNKFTFLNHKASKPLGNVAMTRNIHTLNQIKKSVIYLTFTYNLFCVPSSSKYKSLYISAYKHLKQGK